jgi:hypothetical protein
MRVSKKGNRESRWTVRRGREAVRFFEFAPANQPDFRIGLSARAAFSQRHGLLFVRIATFATTIQPGGGDGIAGFRAIFAPARPMK